MSIPDFQTVMLPVLRRLAERAWRTPELVDAIAVEFLLTPEERSEMLPSGRQTRVANRTHWALAYLNKAGLIVRLTRGEYAASESGRALLASPPDRLTVTYLSRHYEGVRAFRSRENSSEDTSDEPLPQASTQATNGTPDDAIDAAITTIEQKVRDDLLQRLLEITPSFFEKVVVDLLLAMGYGSTAEDAGQTIGGTGDGGVDGVVREDRLGLDLIYLQAKRYRDTAVNADQLRSFAGALDDKGARKGVFITTSRFTADAERFAERQQMKRIVLIDGERLTRLMLRHDVGVRASRTITLKRLDLDYFEPDDTV
jgi:restriction system protein